MTTTTTTTPAGRDQPGTTPAPTPTQARPDGGPIPGSADQRGVQRGLVPRVAWAAAAVAVVVGVVLRFVATSDLWLDEALTVTIARLPLREIGPALRLDGHPPLYYVLLHGWTAAFGTSDLAVRSLSGIFAVAALPLMWAAGQRLGGRSTAALATFLLATSPFAVRYATEARMYSLVTLLALGLGLAVARALERATPRRLAEVALCTAALLLTHYWGLYLVAATVAVAVGLGWRRPAQRAAAVRVAIAVVLGSLAFVPWLPTFAWQARHTGTPWGRSVDPAKAVMDTVIDFGGGKWLGGRLLGPLLVLLVLLALFARAIDRYRLEVDLRTVAGARPEAAVAAATLLLGIAAAVAASSAFQPRYTAGILPFALLAAAVGIERLPHPRLQQATVVAVCLLGLAGAVRADIEPRTQAGTVAAAVRRGAEPGDVIAYCPDQLEPAVHRLLGGAAAEFTYPAGDPPGRIDWADYRGRIHRSDPLRFARQLEQRAAGHAIWLVTGTNYRGFGGDCAAIRRHLGEAGRRSERIFGPDHDAYERETLTRFTAR
ncbi:MAG: hypothetical protein JWM89_938 [Acidimicrobiales bacterium]|nr:hypothetical protein [Acidimicrobiales bacterium]